MTNDNRKGSNVLKAGLGYTVGNYLIKGLSFLTIPIFARLLDSADYGKYNTYMAFEAIVYIFVGLALHASFKKAKYKFEAEFNKFVSACTVLSIISFFMFLILAVVSYPLLKGMWGFKQSIVILLFIHSFGSALIQFYNAYIALYYDYARFLKLSIFNAVLNIVLSIGLIVAFGKGDKYIGRILGIAIPVIIIGIYIIFFFFKKAKPNITKAFWKYGISYSLPIIPHGLSQIVLAQFDRIMITNMIGSAEAGIYSFGYNIYTIIQVTANSLSNVWEPWFFENIAKNEVENIRKKGQLLAICMLGFSIIIVLLSPELILLLGTKKYADAVYCVPPIVMGGYFSFLYILPCEVEYYYEKTSYISVATCFAAGINVFLNYICINLFGYISAAYTTLITYFIYFAFHYFMAKKIQGFYLYSNNTITIIVIIAFATCFWGVFLIPFVGVRIVLSIVVVAIVFFYVEKTIKIKKFLKRKMNRNE